MPSKIIFQRFFSPRTFHELAKQHRSKSPLHVQWSQTCFPLRPLFPPAALANSDMCIYGRTSKDPARGPERGPSKIVFAWSRRPLPISGTPGRRTCLSHKGPLSALFSMHGRPPEDPRTEEGSGREFLSPLSGPIPNRVKTVGGDAKGHGSVPMCVCVRERERRTTACTYDDSSSSSPMCLTSCAMCMLRLRSRFCWLLYPPKLRPLPSPGTFPPPAPTRHNKDGRGR